MLCTGDEIVAIHAQPGPAQIRNSNAASLAAQIERGREVAVVLPIAPDEPVRLRELLEQGLTHDLLLISGGVSIGKLIWWNPRWRSWAQSSALPGRRSSPASPSCLER